MPVPRTSSVFHYVAYGLKVSCCLECPELAPAGPVPDELADVTIWYGPVPERLDWREDRLLFRSENGRARFLVSDGSEIRIERGRGLSDEELRANLFGSVLGAVLQQRRILALHGSAVSTPVGAAAFLGDSGAGKSTLAAGLLAKGFPVIADDICAITFDEAGAPLVAPAYPQIKLWEDSLVRLGHDPEEFPELCPGFEKKRLLIHRSFHAQPTPLRLVYVLDPGEADSISLHRLRGSAKLSHVYMSRYRPEQVPSRQWHVEDFEKCIRAANHTLVCQVRRPRSKFYLDELLSLLADDFDQSTEQFSAGG